MSVLREAIRRTGEVALSRSYQLADIEDRYERRMREMIQAKLKGEGITEHAAEPAQSNVIGMADHKRSLGSSTEAPATKPASPSRRSKPAERHEELGQTKRAHRA